MSGEDSIMSSGYLDPYLEDLFTEIDIEEMKLREEENEDHIGNALRDYRIKMNDVIGAENVNRLKPIVQSIMAALNINTECDDVVQVISDHVLVQTVELLDNMATPDQGEQRYPLFSRMIQPHVQRDERLGSPLPKLPTGPKPTIGQGQQSRRKRSFEGDNDEPADKRRRLSSNSESRSPACDDQCTEEEMPMDSEGESDRPNSVGSSSTPTTSTSEDEGPPIEQAWMNVDLSSESGSSCALEDHQKFIIIPPRVKVLNGIGPLRRRKNGRHRPRARCGECSGCRRPDCGKCKYCADMKCFEGPGRLKKCCMYRACQNLS